MTSVEQAVFLGLLQGITEFLPVSSSGHLIFVPLLLGWEDQGLAFDVVVHLGTLLAVVFYFRGKLSLMTRAVLSRNETLAGEKRLAFLALASLLPAALFALLVKDFVETEGRNALLVGFNLVFWGVLLWLADWKARHKRELRDLNLRDALFIGVFQALSIIPGTSRSGATMTAGLFSGLKRKDAAEVSFLMGVPAIAAAGALKVGELLALGTALPFGV